MNLFSKFNLISDFSASEESKTGRKQFSKRRFIFCFSFEVENNFNWRCFVKRLIEFVVFRNSCFETSRIVLALKLR